MTMAMLRLHYDGWLALPADLRRKLGLTSGDRLEAELAQGAIVLRPAAKDRRPERPGEAAAAIEPSIADDAGAPREVVPAKRKPGRPRKVAAAGEFAPTPASKKARGRPPKTGLAPVPGPNAFPPVSIGPAKLLKKADLEAKAAPTEPAAPPADTTGWAKRDTGSRFEERRPFRHVEVRKLGPGRGHNKPRRGHAWPTATAPVE
jgi:bifunctional DNA-binding transcriptional regulator/antitoxin component of YhaV-PrlF toxin-antitoxin module